MDKICEKKWLNQFNLPSGRYGLSSGIKILMPTGKSGISNKD